MNRLLPPILFLLHFTTNSESKGCIPRQFPAGVVCVCNATYCDTIEPVEGVARDQQAVVYTTSASGARIEKTIVVPEQTATGSVVTFDPSTVYQEVKGFGGAFTDAAGINLMTLSEAARENLMMQYYGPSGAEYTIGRVPMASCDFSTHEYSYDDVVGDLDLVNFNLTTEDFQYKIPFIKRAMELQNGTGGLKLFSSPWSAPGWMKTNNDMRGGGKLRGAEGGPYYVTWANYFVRFFEEYAKQGITFWGMTVQNEPNTASDPYFPWQTMYFDPTSEMNFIRNLLGPAVRANAASKDVIIMAMDDNRDNMPAWPDTIFGDEVASSYTAGLAIHWYMDPGTPADILTQNQLKHPDKFMLATEACTGWTSPVNGVILGNFTRAEDYAWSIITDMNNYVTGWTDWNICLDTQGGPNWVNNYVDSPIIVNATNDEFLKEPMYYALAHFSKFLKPGSHRVGVTLPDGLPSTVLVLGVVDTEGRNVAVVLNGGDQDTTLSFTAKQDGYYVNLALEGHSITTVIWEQ